MGIHIGSLRIAFFCSAIILLFGFPHPTGGAGMDFDLDAYQWKNRVIIIFAPSSNSNDYKRQMRVFEGHEDGILDRDLIVLELFENGESRWGNFSLSKGVAPQMRRQFDAGEDQFSIFLIGKDGTVKLRSVVPLSLSEIFGLIDAMPMRQEEMRRKQNSNR